MDRNARVLVADDDPELLESVAAGLEATGARVVRAASGAELIEQVADHGPFDLLVTDVSMPWMSGLDVVRSARSAGLRMPVVVMTALPDDRVDRQVSELGERVVLLRKPFDLVALQAAVERVMQVA